MRIGWFVAPDATLDLASIRYRAAYPILALSQLDHRNYIFRDLTVARSYLPHLNTLIIVKRLDMASLELGAEADERGLVVILDLCDDILIDGYRTTRPAQNRMVFAALSEVADAIVVTTPALAARVRSYCPRIVDVLVIPDAIETADLLRVSQSVFARRLVHIPYSKTANGHRSAAAVTPLYKVHEVKASAAQRLRSLPIVRSFRGTVSRLRSHSPAEVFSYVRARLAAKFRRPNDRKAIAPKEIPLALEMSSAKIGGQETALKRVIWFGNNGAPYSDFGVMSLMRAAAALDAVAKEFQFQLTIVTDSISKVSIFARHLSVPVEYIEWSQDRMEEVLRSATVFLLTQGTDEFSSYKSANRATKALGAGVPVVAEPVPGLKGLESVIFVGDIEVGLRRALSGDLSSVPIETLLASDAVAELSLESIASKWNDLLNHCSSRRSAGLVGRALPNRKIAVLIDLVQDVEIALPLVIEIMARGLEPVVITTIRAMTDSRRLFLELASRGIVPTILDNDRAAAADKRWLRGATVLITIAETTAGPHRIANQLTKTAHAVGAKTMTLQHGLENIGLTYRDKIYTEAVNILSQHIYIWGPAASLPDWVSPAVRSRVIEAGRVTPISSPAPLKTPHNRKIVGVFENLHWDRYSSAYREAFLRDLAAVATQCAELLFVVKPHPAGRWAANGKNADEIKAMAPNVVLARPDDPTWASYSGPDIVRLSEVVITSPSTVALDAAMLNRPVAVAAYDLPDLSMYEPLPLLTSTSCWLSAIENAIGGERAELLARGVTFRKKVCLGAGAEKRVIDDAAAHLNAVEYKYPTLVRAPRKLSMPPAEPA